MKKLIKKIKNEMIKGYLRLKGIIGNEKGGWEIVGSIIVGAIVFLALIALNNPIATFFSDTWTQFSNWVSQKLTALFT
ncbi:MAG: hypothetical protein PWQ37_2899 [Candidatus Petromonas sp.]|jgi:hypothetical protein|nr:hypothetical protein [Candidatus Petromonas sp.]